MLVVSPGEPAGSFDPFNALLIPAYSLDEASRRAAEHDQIQVLPFVFGRRALQLIRENRQTLGVGGERHFHGREGNSFRRINMKRVLDVFPGHGTD